MLKLRGPMGCTVRPTLGLTCAVRTAAFTRNSSETANLAALRNRDPSRNKKKLHPIDVCQPARLYPEARKMHRRVIMHVGPTNSGKSYAALQAFRKARSAFYAGPLRMLAREVWDRMEAEQIPCNLVTGDEKIMRTAADGRPATLSCGTIEMTDLSSRLNVAVIDEIQMINDPERGWAWTRAFLGVRAEQVHLCGDANAVHVIKQLVNQTGDHLEVKFYKRLSGLELEADPITPELLVKSLQPGDCVVCFSKKKVKEMRDRIIQVHKKPCAVIYGSLPPEIRAEQAKLFNEPKSGVDFLVATDAIGMGLNLAIRRIIFSTIKKFDGEKLDELTIPQIKQIAGRAGRYRVGPVGPVAPDEPATASAPAPESDTGKVACITSGDREVVGNALRKTSPNILEATCWPPSSVIMASSIDKARKFSEVIEEAFQLAKIGPGYARPRAGNVTSVARLYDHVKGLTFDDKLALSNAPVPDDPLVHRAFVKFCATIGGGHSRNITNMVNMLHELSKRSANTTTLESVHKSIVLFIWLSYRFPCNLVDRAGAMELKELCEEKIARNLTSRRAISSPVRKKPYQAPYRNSVYGH